MAQDMEISEYDNMAINLRNSDCWRKILPYLSLSDVHTLRMIPEIRIIVDTCLILGTTLVIDDASLWKYPVEEYQCIYEEIGMITKNLELRGIYEMEVDTVLELFQGISSLTLSNIHVSETDRECSYPSKHLTSLQMLDCRIYAHFVFPWMLNLTSLKSLYLRNNGWMMLPVLPSLETLTLRDQEIYNGEITKSPKVRNLTVDRWNPDDTGAQPKSFRNLETLTISQSVDPEFKDDINRLGVKHLNVHFYDIPVEHTPIMRLNEYCLMHLEKYLSSECWIAFRESHPYFSSLPISEMSISEGEDPSLLRRVAPYVSKLAVKYVGREEFTTLLPCFKNLSELQLDLKSVDVCMLDVIPIGLKKLTLITYSCPNLKKTFQRLNQTLGSLHLEWCQIERNGKDPTTNQGVGLETLSNIHSFKNENVRVDEEMIAFLMKNQENMKTLELVIDESTELDVELWRVIGGMSKLETLNISCIESLIEIPPMVEGSLPSLMKLIVDTDYSIGAFLDSLQGGKLEYLDISAYADETVLPLIMKYRQLLKLRLLDGKDALEIIEALPNLKDFGIERDNVEPEAMKEIRLTLKKQRRKLRLNDLIIR